MPNGKRLWRTAKGDLVEDGHPEAGLLAYGEGDELADEDRAKVRKAHTAKAEAGTTPKKTAASSSSK